MNDQSTKKYPKGIYANKPFDNAPDFVKLDLSIHKDCLSDTYIQEYGEFINEKGYLKIQVLSGDKGYYGVINTYKPKPREEITHQEAVAQYKDSGTPLDNETEINPSDIPF